MTATFENLTPVSELLSEPGPFAEKSVEFGTQVFDRLFAAAQPGAVFSAPVVCGNYTIITASEVSTGGGFGSGKGFGPAPAPKTDGETAPEGQTTPIGGGGGMGGAGGSNGRPLAIISVGPDGVKVEPVVDATKIAITALTTFGLIFATVLKIRRTVKKAEGHK